jgi:hypothetical protein
MVRLGGYPARQRGRRRRIAEDVQFKIGERQQRRGVGWILREDRIPLPPRLAHLPACAGDAGKQGARLP